MQFTFTITPKGQHTTHHLIRASLFTFLLICFLALGLCLLLLGLLLQASALAAPWLIVNGLAVIKSAVALFLAFRLLLLAFRLIKRVHRRGKNATWYTSLLSVVQGTIWYLLKKLVSFLLC